MTAQPKLFTYADFEAFIRLPENTGRTFELVHGEIVELSPTQEHGLITFILVSLLNDYLKENPIGWGFVEARYKLPEDDSNAYIPDLSFVLKIEGRKPLKKGAAPYIPEFAIEIKSPDDNKLDMREKALYYLKHGGQLVWLVMPDEHEVEVYTLERVQTFGFADTLEGGNVLPGFKVDVKAIFKTDIED